MLSLRIWGNAPMAILNTLSVNFEILKIQFVRKLSYTYYIFSDFVFVLIYRNLQYSLNKLTFVWEFLNMCVPRSTRIILSRIMHL